MHLLQSQSAVFGQGTGKRAEDRQLAGGIGWWAEDRQLAQEPGLSTAGLPARLVGLQAGSRCGEVLGRMFYSLRYQQDEQADVRMS